MSAWTWVRDLIRGPYSAVLDQAGAQPTAPMTLPLSTSVGDRDITLRYLKQTDGSAILAFARALPAHDLLFLRRDITNEEQVNTWLREARSGLATTILAFDGPTIVGYATVAEDGLTWTRHVRELRVMVGPDVRGKHLGRMLIEQAFAVARAQEAKKIAHCANGCAWP